MTKKVDSRKEILNLIDQTIADTNYIKDDNAISNNIYKLLSNWIMLYFVISILLFISFKTATVNNQLDSHWYFPVQRIITMITYPLILIYYFYCVYKKAYSLKERDFLKLYSIVPSLMVFTKIINPLSYYLDTTLLLNLCHTISLDFIALIISSVLLKFYFKDSKLSLYIIYNVFVYLIYILVFSIFISSDNPSLFIIQCNNLMQYAQDTSLIVFTHFIIVLLYIKKVENNRL